MFELCENLGVEGRWERAETLIWMGWMEALHFGNLMKGLSLSKEAEALYRELGPTAEWDLVTVLGGESYIYLYLNNLDEAQSCAEEGLRLARDMDGFTVGRSLTDLGNIAFRRGEFSRAREYFNNSLAIIKDAEDEIRNATIYRKLGTVENALGRHEQAGSLYQQALKIFADSTILDNGSLQVIECMAINEIAWASTDQARDHLLTGARLMGLDEWLRKELGVPIFFEIRLEFEQALATLHGQLDPESLAAAIRRPLMISSLISFQHLRICSPFMPFLLLTPFSRIFLPHP